MLVQFDLNQNDWDALLRHCLTFRPASGDGREDARLVDALGALEQALLQVEREQAQTAR